MDFRRSLAVVVVAAAPLLSACVATNGSGIRLTEEQYSVGAEALRGSAPLRQKFIEQCIPRMNAVPAINGVTIADYIGAPPGEGSRLVCERALRAIVSGRLSYADYLDMRDRRVTIKTLHILQGR